MSYPETSFCRRCGASIPFFRFKADIGHVEIVWLTLNAALLSEAAKKICADAQTKQGGDVSVEPSPTCEIDRLKACEPEIRRASRQLMPHGTALAQEFLERCRTLIKELKNPYGTDLL